MDKQITVSKTTYSKWWPWIMAWRDSRKSRGKLLLFITSISLGIAAMVGITSFRENLMKEIDEQAKALLGADVEVSSNQPLPDSLVYVYRSLTAAESREAYFASMVYFPSTDGTRLTQVRALEGEYPYYGAIETEPVEAATKFKTGQYAIVDEKLMIQYNVEHGDSIRVGKMGFEIIGTIKQIPGQSSIQGGIAPVVYIPYEYIQPTGLVQKGSRINYKSYFQFHPDIDTTNLWGTLTQTTENKGYDVETIEERKEETGEAFSNLSNFLELVAFTALMLGCLGVASAIYVYVKSKVQIVAVLRCLGM
ncbi:MAG: ABC transporter permease, partial [Bacteroidota bacterium]